MPSCLEALVWSVFFNNTDTDVTVKNKDNLFGTLSHDGP